MIKVTTKGELDDTYAWLDRLANGDIYDVLDACGQMGVDALARHTPKDTGLAASSWGFNVGRQNGNYAIEWYNTNEEGGVNVAILIQYGHGTGTGGYVPPNDFINPAMKPIFEAISDQVWKEVTK